MKKLFIMILAMHSRLVAMDDWFCTSQASELKGSAFYACGIGSSFGENSARSESFTNAEREFDRFCEKSRHCRENRSDVRIEPKRIECANNLPGNPFSNSFKCVRLVIFHIPD